LARLPRMSASPVRLYYEHRQKRVPARPPRAQNRAQRARRGTCDRPVLRRGLDELPGRAIVCGMSEYPVRLSARDAAARCGVSDRTVRRWIARGRLPAERDGRDFRIDPAELGPLIGQLADNDSDDAAAESDVSEQVPHPAAALSDGLSERIKLLEMLDQRDRTIMELAGRVGYYQAENEQLRTTLKALQAPQEEPPVQESIADRAC
jgi:excisionase family DNA binding protein